jgi:hypothetical protein
MVVIEIFFSQKILWYLWTVSKHLEATVFTLLLESYSPHVYGISRTIGLKHIVFGFFQKCNLLALNLWTHNFMRIICFDLSFGASDNMIIRRADDMAWYSNGILKIPMCKNLYSARWYTLETHQYKAYIMFSKNLIMWCTCFIGFWTHIVFISWMC